MKKEFIPVECNKIACSFYNKCCKCATEVVRIREEDSAIDIMFVGQGAGAEEDQKGKPFQGPAGRVLRTKVKPILETDKLNIILDNTIRSRPLDNTGKNRAPTEKEVEFCMDFLFERIQRFKPKVIIPLGASATGTLIPLLKGTPISKCRGQQYSLLGCKVIPTFHPAAILHASDIETKTMMDMSIVKDINDAVNIVRTEFNLI